MSFIMRTAPILAATLAAWLAQTAVTHAYTYKVIYNFCSERACADGANPNSGLTLDAAGNIYGATANSWSDYGGDIFELSPTAKGGWRFQKLKSKLQSPNGHFVIDTNGNLYGTAAGGGSKGFGVVFELVKNGESRHPTWKELISFSEFDPNGWSPSGLTYQGASTGALYDGISPLFGTTDAGGSKDLGVAYTLTLSNDTWNETVLYSFCSQRNCKDGENPEPVIMDTDGNLFGYAVTFSKKGKPYSLAFEIQNDGSNWSETVIHKFCTLRKCADGNFATSTPFFDTDGDLLGNTYEGGDGHKSCCGVLFQLSPQGTNSPYTVLTSFCETHNCVDGAEPTTDIVMDAAKNVFGATSTGGRYRTDLNHLGGGTVYEWNGTALQTLYSFCKLKDCADGEYPAAGLVMDASGNLFGATSDGGKHGEGVVFELSP